MTSNSENHVLDCFSYDIPTFIAENWCERPYYHPNILFLLSDKFFRFSVFFFLIKNAVWAQTTQTLSEIFCETKRKTEQKAQYAARTANTTTA